MSEKQEKSIEIKDLQTLLRKCLNCDELEVIKYFATGLLPLGENYMSVLVKLDAVVRRSKDAKVENLNYVAKMSMLSDQPLINWSSLFNKELYFYAKLVPEYEKIAREKGMEDAMTVFPKFIGYRSSLDDTKNIVDEHSMLILENLKTRDYYNCDKWIGFDVEHARICVIYLAKYHALGIRLKQKRPDIYETVLGYTQVSEGNFQQIDEAFDSILKVFRETKSLNKHLAIIEPSFERGKNGKLWCDPGVEPWNTLVHADFWVNNIMFHKNKNGLVDDVKFVDFQTYLYNSPLKDLSCLFINSLSKKTKTEYIDELIALYYETFIQSLERLGCDTKPFSRKAFDEELKRQAIRHFPMGPVGLKFFTFEITENQKRSTIFMDVLTSENDDEYIKQLQDLIKFFETRGWF